MDGMPGRRTNSIREARDTDYRYPDYRYPDIVVSKEGDSRAPQRAETRRLRL
jgi:hypothetical protein